MSDAEKNKISHDNTKRATGINLLISMSRSFGASKLVALNSCCTTQNRWFFA